MQSLFTHFISISDPRSEVNKAHKLINILMVAVCAVLAGAESFVDMEDFGITKETWFKTFLELPNGIPSHDTFGRVFSLLDPNEFQTHFSDWMQSVTTVTKDQVIAIDGKTNRRTFGNLTKALHLVSAFATANGVALGQVATDKKSNEITAIPELLKRAASSRPTPWVARVTSPLTSWAEVATTCWPSKATRDCSSGTSRPVLRIRAWSGMLLPLKTKAMAG